MIYLTPPGPNQGWRIHAEYPKDSPRKNRSITIKDEVAKVLADKGVPVVLPEAQSVGATEEALYEALEELDRQELRISKRALKEITYTLLLAEEDSRLLLPQVYWDYQRALDAVKEAKARCETAHQELMRYATEKLGLPEGTVLVEGPHKCIKSPTHTCLYDHEEDRCHDECLVCGEPEERN